MADITGITEGSLCSVNESTFVKRTLDITWENIIASGEADSTGFTDNDTVTFTIPVKAGEIVDTVGVRLINAFTDSGSGDELDIKVGDGSDDDGFIVNADLHDSQTEISYVVNTGAYLNDGTTDNTINGKLYTSDDTLDVKLTPNVSTGTDYSLSELTAGHVKVTALFKSLV